MIQPNYPWHMVVGDERRVFHDGAHWPSVGLRKEVKTYRQSKRTRFEHRSHIVEIQGSKKDMGFTEVFIDGARCGISTPDFLPRPCEATMWDFERRAIEKIDSWHSK